MARTVKKPDAGNYNQPAEIQKPAAWSENGQGGNANAGQWTTVRSPMIHLYSGQAGRGASLTYKYGQLYPDARYWAETWYSSDVAIDARLTLLYRGQRYRILGAIDPDEQQMILILPLVLYQARGTGVKQ